jgi:hypothetical protein
LRLLKRLTPATLALLPLCVFAAPSLGAAPDGNVEWNGVSHVSWQDRRPVCPVGREGFQVRFQSYANDLTSARLYVVNGGAGVWVTATPYGTRGVYDLWTAQVPASITDTLRYWIELTDGADTDALSANGMNDGTPADGGFLMDFATLSHAPVGATRVNNGGTSSRCGRRRARRLTCAVTSTAGAWAIR